MTHKEKVRIARRMYKPVYEMRDGKKVKVKELGIFNNKAWNTRAANIQVRVKNREIIAKFWADKRKKEKLQAQGATT